MSLGRGAANGIFAAVRKDARRTTSRSVAASAAAALVASTAAASIQGACGGTTGREGLDMPGLGDGGGLDGTASVDTGAFDVPIAYVDRALPDVAAPVESGGEAGSPYPNCPPFIPVGIDGKPVPAGTEVDQVPSDWDAGVIVPATSGSVCATYAWLGSVAADHCVTSNWDVTGALDYMALPPCNWAADAGLARQGSSAGFPRYDVCLDLYACLIRTGCGFGNVSSCLCGGGSVAQCDAGGPCAVEELAALEYRPDEIQDAVKNYADDDPSFSGYAGSALNHVFQVGTANSCFDAGKD
jgi:hypothetical protein